MKINDDHMYHGAALTQIAEHPQFTAINSIRVNGAVSRSAFKINDKIGVYLKYASQPKQPAEDYNFTFNGNHKKEIQKLSTSCEAVFVAMVCIEGREICCITHGEFQSWITKREQVLGKKEELSTILVGLPHGKAFRLNMNMPKRRKVYLTDSQLIARKAFPERLFS